MHTQAIEDYLKAIYEIQETDDNVSTTALAARLKVKPASVTGMIKKLANLNLVVYEPYRGVVLSEAGRKAALEVVRHHRLIEVFLAEALGIPWDMVHGEAHRIEHALSEYLEERIDAAFGYPKTDPHGAPIPTREGVIHNQVSVPLAHLRPGQSARVVQVTDGEPTLLRRIADLGIFPQTHLTVVDAEPSGQYLTVRVGDSLFTVDRDVCNNTFVSEITTAP